MILIIRYPESVARLYKSIIQFLPDYPVSIRQRRIVKIAADNHSSTPKTGNQLCYGIGTLMSFYLEEDFKPEYIEIVAEVESEEYYVNMMIAWYLATALAKQWDATIPYLEERKLSPWVHRKTIQKAVESYRITDEQKVYLKTLRENC